MEALWNRRLGGQCLSIGDYVAMPGPPDEVTAAGGPLMLASLSLPCVQGKRPVTAVADGLVYL